MCFCLVASICIIGSGGIKNGPRDGFPAPLDQLSESKTVPSLKERKKINTGNNNAGLPVKFSTTDHAQKKPILSEMITAEGAIKTDDIVRCANVYRRRPPILGRGIVEFHKQPSASSCRNFIGSDV
jgi:hypothetical protein